MMLTYVEAAALNRKQGLSALKARDAKGAKQRHRSDRAGSETGGQTNHQTDGQADIRSQADTQHWIITYVLYTIRQTVTGSRTALDNNVWVVYHQTDGQTELQTAGKTTPSLQLVSCQCFCKRLFSFSFFFF